jgi:hypothetical protein
MWLLLALVPLLALVLGVAFFSVNVPVWDDWSMVPLLQKAYAGTLSFTDLWEPYTQHRMVLPRLLAVANAHLTGWNLRWQMALSLGLAVGLWLVLIRMASRSAAATGRASPPWLPVLLSLLVFSLSAHEDWFGAFWFYNPLLALCAGALALLLTQAPWRWGRLAGAAALALVATYSYSLGLILWPLGLLALWWQRSADRRCLTQALPVWLALGVGNLVAYFAHYRAMTGAPPPAEALAHPGEYLHFVLDYLGAPLGIVNPRLAFCLGLLGSVLVVAMAILLVRLRREAWPAVQPYLLLALFALGTALVTGLGRAQGGWDLAMAPRYVPLSGLLWIAVVSLGALAWSGRPAGGRSARRLLRSSGLVLLMASVAFFSIRSSGYALSLVLRRYHDLAPMAEAIRRGDEARLFVLGNYTAEELRPWREFLREHRLSVFREGPDRAAVGSAPPLPPGERAGGAQ